MSWRRRACASRNATAFALRSKPGAVSRNRERDERGASLILALMFVTSIAFMLAASLDFATASFSQSNQTLAFRGGLGAGEGAIDVLVASMRSDATLGRMGVACPGASLAVGDGRFANAACIPAQGSGTLLTGGSGARANRVVDVTASVGPTVIIRARVVFLDNGGSQPGLSVQIREWSSAL